MDGIVREISILLGGEQFYVSEFYVSFMPGRRFSRRLGSDNVEQRARPLEIELEFHETTPLFSLSLSLSSRSKITAAPVLIILHSMVVRCCSGTACGDETFLKQAACSRLENLTLGYTDSREREESERREAKEAC